MAPCFSSYIEIAKSCNDNLTRVKELHYFVSLTGPYYTVVGMDKTIVEIAEPKKDGTFQKQLSRNTTFLITSPMLEFADLFKQVCDLIEMNFEGYRFVPFNLYEKRIDSLDVGYTDVDFPLNRVFNALFNMKLILMQLSLLTLFIRLKAGLRKAG